MCGTRIVCSPIRTKSTCLPAPARAWRIFPGSNCRPGSGIAPLRRMVEPGVPVALGVDGSASNDTANLLGEARQALLLQRAAGPQCWGGVTSAS